MALVPWLRVQDALPRTGAVLASAWAMTVLFTVAVFGWFAVAVARYTGAPVALAVALLAMAAPLLQPQFLAHALVRSLARRRHAPGSAAALAACAWLACEWAWPKLLGDTLGHGLQPSDWWRQAADLGGVPLLTLALLLTNEAVASAWSRRRAPAAAWRRPALVALAIPLVLAGYGAWRLHDLTARPEQGRLRVGLVQANITDYEGLRRRDGAYAVVSHVLDAHLGLSAQLVQAQSVDALLWPETVYPTTYGRPKSEAGAEFDAALRTAVRDLGRPLVFGTYDRDANGEYNAAAFLARDGQLVGRYRKSRPFPLTEHVPAWLDGPRLRAWLPWTGQWQAGDGARVFPLQLLDGREVPVLPLICLDDVDPALAITGAQQGAQAILGLSNDAWFAASPAGARLHLQVAAFRSVETRLPQLRATTNGLTAVVDADGTVVAQAPPGESAALAGEVVLRAPMTTLAMAWGAWPGPVALAVLLLAGIAARRTHWSDGEARVPTDVRWPIRVSVLPRWARIVAGTLRVAAALGMAWLAWGWLRGDPDLLDPVVQARRFVAVVGAPVIAAWLLQRAYAVSAAWSDGALLLPGHPAAARLEAADVVGLRAWRVPLPGPGLRILRRNGSALDLAVTDPIGLVAALGWRKPAGDLPDAASALAAWLRARAALPDTAWDRGAWKWLAFPLLPALVAFRLHQHIAFGSTFGEWQAFGAQAWFAGLALWWLRWAVGLAIVAGVLRALLEAGTWLAAAWQPGRVAAIRRLLRIAVRAAYWLGVPAWLGWRLLGGG